MSDRIHDDEELREAQRREQEAREAWKRARAQMKEAFRRAHEERKRARGESEAYREEVEEAIRELAEVAQEFAREFGGEARRLADDVWRSARHEWHGKWREQWKRSFGEDWQTHWLFGGRRFRGWSTGEETNPFVAALLSRGGGLLAVCTLHLLAEQPRHGNDIMRQIEHRTMGSWGANPGAIYPLLSIMEEKGLVRSEWEDPDKRTRRIYQITPEGRQELSRLRQILRPKVMEAIEVLHIIYDDIYGNEDKPEGGATAGQEPAEPGTQPGGDTPGPAAEDQLSSKYREQGPYAGWRARLRRQFGLESGWASAFGA